MNNKTKGKILIVEDEADMRAALKKIFEVEGFAVQEAENGQTGLKVAQESHPDLILLDILMPVMDGLATLKKLREDRWGKRVPVIMLTNISDGLKLDEAMDLGAKGYMLKADWSLKDIVERVKSILAVD